MYECKHSKARDLSGKTTEFCPLFAWFYDEKRILPLLPLLKSEFNKDAAKSIKMVVIKY